MRRLYGWATDIAERFGGQLNKNDHNTLLRQAEDLSNSGAAETDGPRNPLLPLIVRDDETLRNLVDAVGLADDIAIDLETSGLDPRRGEIVGIGIAVPDWTFYVPVAHRFDKTNALRPGQIPLLTVLAEVELREKNLIAHNAKFEFKWLRHHGNLNLKFGWDTMIAAKLLRSDLSADLEKVAIRELDVPAWSLPMTDMKRMQLLSIDTVAAYCAKDCWYTLQLFRRQRECLV
jgi:DNA polymerase I-like protein with 3'-5' exonuclease and polymerase domains